MFIASPECYFPLIAFININIIIYILKVKLNKNPSTYKTV